MTPLTWVLVISGVLLNAAAQLLLKWATSATGPIALSWAGLTNATPRLLAHYGLWSGIACYGISVIVWIVALSRAQVSTVYPLLSIGYIVNAVGAALLLGIMPVSPVILGETNTSAPLATFLTRMVTLNVLLAVFNLLPIPPLDGGNVLSGLLPRPMARMFDQIRPYGFILLYAVILTHAFVYLVAIPSRFLINLLL